MNNKDQDPFKDCCHMHMITFWYLTYFTANFKQSTCYLGAFYFFWDIKMVISLIFSAAVLIQALKLQWSEAVG